MNEDAHRQPIAADQVALVALCLVALLVRLVGLDYQSLWRDEVDSLRFASRTLPELLGIFAKPGENGPLYFLLLRPWLDAAGTSEYALRFPSALAGTVAVPLTYRLARRLLSSSRGFWQTDLSTLSLQNVPLMAALLVTVNPYLLWYGQEGKMYAWLVVLVLAAHLAFLAAVKRGRWWRWLLYLALLGSAVLCHVLALLVLALHAAWLLILHPKSPRRWLPFILTLLVPAVPYFALVGWWQIRLLLNPAFQTGHVFVPLRNILAILLVGLSQGIGPLTRPWLMAPVTFLLLMGLMMSHQNRNDGNPTTLDRFRVPALLATWMLLPPLMLYAVSLSKPLFTDRYLIWIAPAFSLLLALGIHALARMGRSLGWIGLLFLLFLGITGGWRQTHTPIKSDFRAAEQFVASHSLPEDLLMFLMPYSRYTFEYYAGPLEDWADAPYTNSGNPPSQVADEMALAVGDAPAVWLVVSEAGMWDQRGLVRQWLEDHGDLIESSQFTRVTVFRYRLGPQ